MRGDDFWLKAEQLWLSACIGYLYYFGNSHDRHLGSLLDLLAISGASEQNENYQCPLDVLFTDLAKEHPDCFPVRQYQKFKLAAGATAKSILISLYLDTNIRAVRKELRSTTEAVDLIMRKGALPTGGINDIESAAGFAKKGGCLTAGQLLSVRYNLTVAEDVRRFLKTDVPDVPLIMSLAELIHVNRPLASDIGRAVSALAQLLFQKGFKLPASGKGSHP